MFNNNIILLNAKKKLQLSRLKMRNYSDEQIHLRMNSQYSYDMKRTYIEKIMEADQYGKLFSYENSEIESELTIIPLFDQLTKSMKMTIEH